MADGLKDLNTPGIAGPRGYVAMALMLLTSSPSDKVGGVQVQAERALCQALFGDDWESRFSTEDPMGLIREAGLMSHPVMVQMGVRNAEADRRLKEIARQKPQD